MFVLAVVSCLPASAQLRFGIKGGLDVTSMSLSSDVVSSDNRQGFYIGPTAKLSLLDTGFGLDASALYDQRSGKIEMAYGNEQIVNDHEESLTQKQIAIPVNLRYAFGIGSTANVFLFAGPQFGFNVGGDKDNVNYNIACGKTGEIKVSDVLPEVTKNVHARYNAWQIGLAYYF